MEDIDQNNQFPGKTLRKIKVVLISLLEIVFPSVARKYFYFRSKKEPELDLLPSLVSQTDIVIDIGANWGQYTYQLSSICSSGFIYSVEPNPLVFKRLSRLFADAGNVLCSRVAISSMTGRGTLNVPLVSGERVATRGSLSVPSEILGYNDSILADDDTSGVRVESYSVPLESLSNFIMGSGITRLNFLKIDVEGHELDVLKSGESALREFRPKVLIEVERGRADSDPESVFDFFRLQGYSCARLGESGKFFVINGRSEFSAAIDEFRESTNFFPRNNYLFIHSSDDIWLNSNLFSQRG